MIFRFTTFKGIIPRLFPKLLPAQAAQTAENVSLLSGRLEAIQEPDDVTASVAAAISIYKWYRNSTSEWLSWTTDVDVVRGPIADDTYERIYFTGDGNDLKVLGWDGGKEERTVSMASPAAPSITVANILDPFSRMDIRSQTDYGLEDQTGQQTDETGSVLSYVFEGSDRIRVRFQFPAQSYPTVTKTTVGQYPTFFVNITLKVGVDANLGGSIAAGEWLPAAYGSDLQAQTWNINDGTDYGTLSIESYEVLGRTIDYNYTTSGADGAIAPEVSEYQVEVIFKVDWATYATETKYVYYCQTYIDDWGQESPASAVSAEIEWQPGQTVTLAGIADPGGDIVGRRLYRSAAGSTEDAFYFLAEQQAWSTAYVDEKTDAQLGERMPEFNNPTSGITGLIAMPGGWLAAFKDKTLHCTEPWLPYTWPEAYELTFEYDIVALAPSGNDMIVMTTGNPYIVTGTHPSLLTQTRLMLNQSCVSKRGVAQVGRVVAYPSPDGLVMVQGGQARLSTKNYYKKEDWEAIDPDTLLATVYDKRYYGWADSGSIIFDFDEGIAAVTTTDETATAVFNDLQSDSLFIVQSNMIKEWNAGTDPLKLTWKSKEFELKAPSNMKVARVKASTYPVDGSGTECTLKIYAKGVLVSTQEVFDDDAFLLPRLRPERVWSFQIESYHDVEELAIATSMAELR